MTPKPPETPVKDSRPVQLTLPHHRLQPAEWLTGLVALALVALVPGVYEKRQQEAWAKTHPIQAPMPLAGGEVVPGVSGAPAQGTVVASRPALPEIRVHVVGAVDEPGVVELSPASRVEDAIRLAGGPTSDADLSKINLAENVTDGQQIYVPEFGENPPSSSNSEALTPNVKVRLNAATKEELEVIPGIGPALAQAIIDYRTIHGAFSSIEQLDEVPGIGARKLANLAKYVTLN